MDYRKKDLAQKALGSLDGPGAEAASAANVRRRVRAATEEGAVGT